MEVFCREIKKQRRVIYHGGSNCNMGNGNHFFTYWYKDWQKDRKNEQRQRDIK